MLLSLLMSLTLTIYLSKLCAFVSVSLSLCPSALLIWVHRDYNNGVVLVTHRRLAHRSVTSNSRSWGEVRGGLATERAAGGRPSELRSEGTEREARCTRRRVEDTSVYITFVVNGMSLGAAQTT